jgi:hypothetical protein
MVTCVTKEQVIDVKNSKLTNLLASGLALTQATMEKKRMIQSSWGKRPID